jgi:hypothetical protein
MITGPLFVLCICAAKSAWAKADPLLQILSSAPKVVETTPKQFLQARFARVLS